MHIKSKYKNKKIFKFPANKDWLVSSKILDMSLKAILKKVKVNRQYDVPYVAGYNTTGKKIYIDRHMPTKFKYNNRFIYIDHYLVLHEAIEKVLIDGLKLHYQLAHQIALRAEQAAVRADKVSWKVYDAFMQRYIKKIGEEENPRIPTDLDFKPYRDEHDKALINRMLKSLKNKKNK